MKQRVYGAARTFGLYRLFNHLTRRKLRILCYHGLWVTPGFQYGDRLFMSPEQFDGRMASLAGSGRPLLSLDDAVSDMVDGTLKDGAVVVTIDDGWASTPLMTEILNKHRVPATVYMTTWYVDNQLPIANKTVDYIRTASLIADPGVDDIDSLPLADRLPALVDYSRRAQVPLDWLEKRQFHLMTREETRACHDMGIDMQLHTHRHTIRGLETELRENREILSDMGFAAEKLTHFCYPSGETTPEAELALRADGIRSATLCEPGLNPVDQDPLRLRRFLDGRSVSQLEFEGYLAGFQSVVDGMRPQRA